MGHGTPLPENGMSHSLIWPESCVEYNSPQGAARRDLTECVSSRETEKTLTSFLQ